MKKLVCVFVVLVILIINVSAKGIEQTNLETFNLRTKSGYTAEELDKVLKYDLKGLGEYFIKAEEDYCVNAVFLASVAALESGWGRYCFRENNMFGYGGMAFNSKAECIDFVARKISENYLSENGKYHSGYTVKAVNCYYNGREIWEDTVIDIMSSLMRKIER